MRIFNLIFSLFAVCFPLICSGAVHYKFRTTAKDSTINNEYILYVNKIIELKDSIIYGQNIDTLGNTYGCENLSKNSHFKKILQNIGNTNLDIRRDSLGIYFVIPRDNNLDSLNLFVYSANNLSNNDTADWHADTTKVYEINWILKEPEPAEVVSDMPWYGRDFIPWLLFFFSVLISYYLIYSKNKSSKSEHQNEKVDTLSEQLANQMKLLDEIQLKCIGQVEKIKVLNNEIQSLKATIDRLSSDIKRKDTPFYQKNTVIPVIDSKPIKQTEAIVVCEAEPGDEPKTIVGSSNGMGVFTITRETDGTLTYLLKDSEEVRSMFETNASMLDIYRQSGILSYDNIPQNSHVKIAQPGKLKEIDSNRFVVVSAMQLTFEV